jgi:hypothetical protein
VLFCDLVGSTAISAQFDVGVARPRRRVSRRRRLPRDRQNGYTVVELNLLKARRQPVLPAGSRCERRDLLISPRLGTRWRGRYHGAGTASGSRAVCGGGGTHALNGLPELPTGREEELAMLRRWEDFRPGTLSCA